MHSFFDHTQIFRILRCVFIAAKFQQSFYVVKRFEVDSIRFLWQGFQKIYHLLRFDFTRSCRNIYSIYVRYLGVNQVQSVSEVLRIAFDYVFRYSIFIKSLNKNKDGNSMEYLLPKDRIYQANSMKSYFFYLTTLWEGCIQNMALTRIRLEYC